MRWNGLWIAGALVLVGCARSRTGFPGQTAVPAGSAGTKPSTAIVTPAPANSGRITSVNPAARFVVVTYPIGAPLPALERKLDVYRAGLKVGEIKITGPSRDLNTVADISAGDCQPGDEVRGD